MQKLNLNKNFVYYETYLDGGGSIFGIEAMNSIQKHLKPGKVLEMFSGPAFMGFYLKFNELAETLYLSDINLENEACINKTIKENNLKNVKFIHSDIFDSFDKNIIFDTIICNPPHFKTPRPWGYKEKFEKLISLDEDMHIHKKFFKDVKQFMHNDTKIVLIEHPNGVTIDDIQSIIADDFIIDYTESNRYGWIRDIQYRTIILKLKNMEVNNEVS
jgi:methylase of polypeptide subunit release factors